MVTTVAPGKGPVEIMGHWGLKDIRDAGSGSQSTQQSQQSSISNQASQNLSASSTYIPDYLESPILRSIAQQAQGMAAPIYQWGMEQFNKNQGNIDTMMRNALTYASPQRIKDVMGQAQAGVQQGAEAGRQSAIQDLQSYGIDPSSGRYAALDQASRVMSGATAAGAGNQARMATEAQGTAMQNQAMGLSLQNVNTGYGAANAANQFLGTASQLKFPPLGTTSMGIGSSTGGTTSQGTSSTDSSSRSWDKGVTNWAEGGSIPDEQISDDSATSGGFVSNELSPSNGSKTDDVDARLNAGEFVIPKDVAAWKGQEFFYKLMAQARKTRAMAESENGTPASDAPEQPEQMTGYQAGGGIMTPARGTVVPPPVAQGQPAGAPVTMREQLPARGTVVTPPNMIDGIPPVTGYGMNYA
jgi:hypothetical protein